MERKKNDIIPRQRVGNKLDTTQEHRAESEPEAREKFGLAVERLLDVNHWDEICGPLSAKFTLTDQHGSPVSRELQPGDHFRIDVPGPGPGAGDGYDWVQVEAIEDKRDESASEEAVTIRVRPAPSPLNASRDTAHFFDETATSSFRVRRVGLTISAEVHGRNEVPNTDVESGKDKVRNAVVGTGATVASKPQWKSLVDGLLQ